MRGRETYVLAILLCAGAFIPHGIGQENKSHQVTVNHPAFREEDPNIFYLQELEGDNNNIAGYSLDVKSVICFDHTCKVVPVRLFWDLVGSYQTYELGDGIILEKKEGKAFNDEDYDRLQEILQDKSSPYKDFSYYEITQERVQGEGEVDAVSGPSPVIVDETKTIAGAAWTCFTLWHWVNGEIVGEIQRISGESSSIDDLVKHIHSGDFNRYEFAIHELFKRENHDSQVLEAIITQVIKERKDSRFLTFGLKYMEQARTEVYFSSVENLLHKSNTERRMLVFQSLLTYKTAPPVGYFDQFLDEIIATKHYPEINLLLTILERQKSTTSSLIAKFVPLLEEEYSILNRRVYWFLSEQQLSPEQKKVVNIYYNRYASFL